MARGPKRTNLSPSIILLLIKILKTNSGGVEIVADVFM